MDDRSACQEEALRPLTGPRARAALTALIARLSDADAVALWQLIASSYPVRLDDQPTLELLRAPVSLRETLCSQCQHRPPHSQTAL
jgi:hypothetical protein